MRQVVFVASNGTHCRSFAPVIRECDSRGVASVVLSLDQYYAQGASQTARELDLSVIELPRRRGRATRAGYYARSLLRIWFDTIAAVPEARKAISDTHPCAVVVGNDHGLLEKVALREARLAGVRSILVQDGRLAPRPSAINLASRFHRWLKGTASVILRRLGLGFLAASDYGSGGADIICASGRVSATILSRRAAKPSRVVITGQPRYDHLAGIVRPQEPKWDVVMFTTPFVAAGLSSVAEQRQHELTGLVASWASRRGLRFAVKPHPREENGAYAELGADRVTSTTAGEVLAKTGVAITGISTLIEEAALMECPVLVLGELVHDASFEVLLPPRSVYPRLDTFNQLETQISRIEDLGTRADLLRRQSQFIARHVFQSPEGSASSRVAEFVLRAAHFPAS